MKQHYLTLLAFMACLAGSAFAQVTSYSFQSYPDSVGSCTETVWFAGIIGSSDESQADITINWGDGTTTNHSFTAAATTTYWQNFQHGYALAGNYTVAISVYSATAGATVDAGQSVNLSANDPSNCGYVFISTAQVSPLVNYPDALYDFTGADGITTTISQNSNPNMWSGYSGLNTANTPYTVSLNDNWLTNNGLTQVSPDFTITSFNANGSANPLQVSMEVDCAVNQADPNMSIQYSWAGPFVAPLQTGNIQFSTCNYACNNTADATVSVTFPAVLTPDLSNLPGASVNGNVVTLLLANLSDCANTHIPFTFPGTVTAGTPLEFYLHVDAVNESDPVNNYDTIYTTVLNSYDPNNKLVDQPTRIDPFSAETLQYVINFQNEGNFNALDVVVIDTISPHLDLTTFTVLGSKHGVATSVNTSTRVVTFSFNDIQLAPASQDEEGSKGFVVYSIRENADLPIGTEIENTAYIYFDFNPAIITNTTYNVNEVLANTELNGEALVMYPNPAATHIYFSGATVQEVRVFDMAGKTVLHAAQPLNNQLEVTALNNGLYQVQLITEKGLHTQKLIVKK